MRKLRLGIIGAGSWTVSSHLPSLERWRDNVEFTIVNRRDPAQLAVVKERFGFAMASTDWRDVIAERPDLVIVASPPVLHWEQSKAALEAGAHVLCEKPFTLDPGQAWDLHATSERTGKHLLIAYGWNYTPMAVEADRLLNTGGGIGEIEAVMMRIELVNRALLTGSGAYPSAAHGFTPGRDTFANPATSGGGFGQASLTHVLGVGLWLSGLRAREVFALMFTPAGSEVELHDALSVRFTNGAVGSVGGHSIHASIHSGEPLELRPPGMPPRSRIEGEVRLVGSSGMMRIGFGDNVLWKYTTGAGYEIVPLSPDAGVYTCDGPVDALVEAALGQPFTNRSPAELGARTTEILEAAYRSAASGWLEPVAASAPLPSRPNQQQGTAEL